jgi:hypothetical protein
LRFPSGSKSVIQLRTQGEAFGVRKLCLRLRLGSFMESGSKLPHSKAPFGRELNARNLGDGSGEAFGVRKLACAFCWEAAASSASCRAPKLWEKKQGVLENQQLLRASRNLSWL